MTVTVKTKSRITSLSHLAVSMWTDMTDGGMLKTILPTTGAATPPEPDVNGNVKFVVETTDLTNPLNATQPYRILVEVLKNSRMRIAIANPLQIDANGEVTPLPGNKKFRDSHKSGMLGTKWDDDTPGTDDFPTDTQFMVRDGDNYPGGDLSGSPISYSLTISDHGVAFFCWDDDTEDKPRSSWFVVQSPVDKTTGAPRMDKNSPIFCVYSCNTVPDGIFTASQIIAWLEREEPVAKKSVNNGSQYSSTQFKTWLVDQLRPPIGGIKFTGGSVDRSLGWGVGTDVCSIYKFVVNEADVFVPSKSVRADLDQPDSAAIINTTQQVAIATGNQYLVTIPNRLNTQRYAYTDELDLIGYTSADVISQDSDVPVTVYGESGPRTYKAMKASGPNNTGVRILVLVDKAK